LRYTQSGEVRVKVLQGDSACHTMGVTIPSRRLLMRIEDLDARWPALSDEVMTGMKDWRVQHPKATFREIEAALDERLARLRVRMLEDA
jgi:hypothetical protein